MRRPSLAILVALGTSAFASSAGAEPAVLFVPDVDIELNPLGIGDCSAQTNSAGGCDGVPMPVTVPPHPEAPMLRTSLAAALAPYDVHITDQRPPPYLPYTMLLPSDDPTPRSESFTCSAGGINCSALKRNDIVHVYGPTQNCTVSDLFLTSLFAFGRISGLEGVTEPADAMMYPPDFSMGTGSFVDSCMTIANRLGINGMGETIELPLECTQFDHPSCMAGEQNSHADLLDFYGDRVVDVDPPELTNLQPGNGALLPFGFDLELDVEITDADPVVGGRWTIYSRQLEGLIDEGTLTFCTNGLCDGDWPDASPLKATDSDWSATIQALPAGVYEITFEAADFHGNVAVPAMMVIEIGEIPEGTTSDDGMDSDDGSTTGDSGMTTLVTDGSTSNPPPLDDSGGLSQGGSGPGPGTDGGTGDSSQQDDGLIDQGCACRSERRRGGAGLLFVVVLGLCRRRSSEG